MEWLDGVDLRRVRDDGPLHPRFATWIAIQVCQALDSTPPSTTTASRSARASTPRSALARRWCILDWTMRRILPIALGLLGLAGCPSPRPAPLPLPPEQRQQLLGAPPYSVTLTLDREREGSSQGEPLLHALSRYLRRSGVFDLAEGGRGRLAITLELDRSSGRAAVRESREAEPIRTVEAKAGDPSSLARKLADELYRVFTAERSPFASQIAFVAPVRKVRQVHAIDFLGQGLRRVSFDGAHNILPAWSPQRDLLYTSFASGNPDLLLLPAGGRSARTISRRRGLNTGGVFSPNGQQIALTLSEGGNSDIYVLTRQGAQLRQLTRHYKIDVSPSWSPDGSKIVFVSSRSGTAQLHVIPAAGGEARRLATSGSYNQEPDWCGRPGSATIVYTHRRGGARFEIQTIDANTGETKALTRQGGRNTGPSWSPNCRLVVYARERSGLWVVTADGERRWQVHRGEAQAPDWSAH